MSNTMGGERPRNENDFYATPQPLADAICRRLRETIGDIHVVWEPSAGAGAFIRAARSAWPNCVIHANDIAPPSPLPLCRECVRGDCLCFYDQDPWEECDDAREVLTGRALILGNPPFSLAESHVRIALDRLGHATATEPQPRWLAFLLRASFLAGEKRATGLHLGVGGLRYVWNVVGRPSFTGDGKTDGAEYAVLVWQAGYRGTYEGGWLPWRSK